MGPEKILSLCSCASIFSRGATVRDPMKSKTILTVWLSLSLVTAILTASARQNRDELLDRKVSDFHVSDGPPSLVLQRLAVTYGVQIGIEATPGKGR